MIHQDHVNLLKGGIPSPGGVWADFGSGSGAFTLALAELVGTEGEIYSIDKDHRALQQQEKEIGIRFPAIAPGRIHFVIADFTKRLELPQLDGAIMANSLHFQRDKEPLLGLILGYLKPGGRLILVEYNVDQGNHWVPYPISYATWEKLGRRSGFVDIRLLSTRPSRFLGEIYAAINLKPG